MYIDNQNTIVSNDNIFWAKESKFWNNYGKIYQHLEAATPYKGMLEDISHIINKKYYKVWLDAGCGPGTMIDTIVRSVKGYEKIFGIDFDGVMLDNATKRLSHLGNVQIKSGDLARPLDFGGDYFDAIVANLVLSYIIIFDGRYTGVDALREVLKEMYRVLNVGGLFVWTTPVENVDFTKVFLASWRQIFNPLTPQYIYYGPKVLSYALKIQAKGRKGIYHFLSLKELGHIMNEVGFKEVVIDKTFAKQSYIISATK